MSWVAASVKERIYELVPSEIPRLGIVGNSASQRLKERKKDRKARPSVPPSAPPHTQTTNIFTPPPYPALGADPRLIMVWPGGLLGGKWSTEQCSSACQGAADRLLSSQLLGPRVFLPWILLPSSSPAPPSPLFQANKHGAFWLLNIKLNFFCFVFFLQNIYGGTYTTDPL